MSMRQTFADRRTWLTLLLVFCIPLSFVAVVTVLPGPIGVVLAVATAMFLTAAVVAVAGRTRNGLDPLLLANGGAHVVRRCAVLGAALQAAILIATNWGEYEGIDVIVFLGPTALLLGAGAGATIGLAVRHRRGRDIAQAR